MNPVVGITNQLPDWVYDLIDKGIDLAYEEAVAELEAQGKTEDEIDKELENFESSTMLVGDWTEDENGKYIIDENGDEGFAASYNNENGDILSIEFSKTTKWCNHTSPCYRMQDGGPCGDLDTKGDSVLAYALPEVTDE